MQQSLHPTVLNMQSLLKYINPPPPTKVKVCTQCCTITPKFSVRHSILPPFQNDDILPWFLSPSFFYARTVPGTVFTIYVRCSLLSKQVCVTGCLSSLSLSKLTIKLKLSKGHFTMDHGSKSTHTALYLKTQASTSVHGSLQRPPQLLWCPLC